MLAEDNKINFVAFTIAIRKPDRRLGSSARSRQVTSDAKKGDSLSSPPLHTFDSRQKLNVIPVVAALSVAPPIVLFAASREQT
jgi:hypothetical protein